MSAKPEVIGTIGDDPEFMRMRVSTLDGIATTLDELFRDNEKLKRQLAGLLTKNAILQAETNEAQLQAAHQIALSKFAEAQMYQRVLALEKHMDQIANYVQRFADAPTRDEFQVVSNDLYALSNRVPL